jgi:hypothetical protein
VLLVLALLLLLVLALLLLLLHGVRLRAPHGGWCTWRKRRRVGQRVVHGRVRHRWVHVVGLHRHTCSILRGRHSTAQ